MTAVCRRWYFNENVFQMMFLSYCSSIACWWSQTWFRMQTKNYANSIQYAHSIRLNLKVILYIQKIFSNVYNTHTIIINKQLILFYFGIQLVFNWNSFWFGHTIWSIYPKKKTLHLETSIASRKHGVLFLRI